MFASLSRLQVSAAQVLTLHAEALHIVHEELYPATPPQTAVLLEQIFADLAALRAEIDSRAARK